MPQLFLSSTFRDFKGAEDHGLEEHPLRRAILEAEGLKCPIWAYERAHGAEPGQDAEDILERCHDAMEASDVILFLVSRRAGMGVEFATGATIASYLEMELFTAATMPPRDGAKPRPVLVLHERGVEPGPVLVATLKALREGMGRLHYMVDDRASLIRRLRDIDRDLNRGRPLERSRALNRLPDFLAATGVHREEAREVAAPRLSFLRGAGLPAADQGAPDRAEGMLDQVEGRRRGEGARLSHSGVLFRVWCAMRELAGPDRRPDEDPQRRAHWDRALRLWAASAQWNGAHGYMGLSPIAAHNSRLGLVDRFGPLEQSREEVELSRSSAIYSLAGRLSGWRARRREYRKVIAIANAAMEGRGGDLTGPLKMRIYSDLQLIKMGEVGRLSRMRADAAAARAMAETHAPENLEAGAAARLIGETRTLAGFGDALAGRRSGIAEIRAGLEMMKQDDTDDGRSFLAMSAKTLELAGRLHFDRAARAEGRALREWAAAQSGAHGQRRAP